MYKLNRDYATQQINSVIRLSDNAWVPIASANTDYAEFKEQIMSDKAQLQDADGNVMTAEAAKEFVRGLL